VKPLAHSKKLAQGSEFINGKQSDMSAGTMLVGWREWVRLPGLIEAPIEAKIDTGARSSALLVQDMRTEIREQKLWVLFKLSSRIDESIQVMHAHPVVARRRIRSSNGYTEMRLFIRTSLQLGKRTWLIDLSLTTSRGDMKHVMLIGREAMGRRLMVHPCRKHLQGKPGDG
jgi:hypothetical protein